MKRCTKANYKTYNLIRPPYLQFDMPCESCRTARACRVGWKESERGWTKVDNELDVKTPEK